MSGRYTQIRSRIILSTCCHVVLSLRGGLNTHLSFSGEPPAPAGLRECRNGKFHSQKFLYKSRPGFPLVLLELAGAEENDKMMK